MDYEIVRGVLLPRAPDRASIILILQQNLIIKDLGLIKKL